MTVNHIFLYPPSSGSRTRAPALGRVLGLLLATRLLVPALRAQDSSSVLGATLRGWEEYSRITIWDRSGSFFGRLAREGILQRFGNRELDAEYDLDLVSFSPSLEEDYRWYHSENGARFWTGSINHLHLVQNAQFSAAVPLGESWSALVQINHQRSLQARRSLVRLTLLHDLRGPRLQLFLTGTLKDDKPDTDLEAGIVWLGLPGSVTLAAGVLDVFNDFITQTLGVEYLTDSIVNYLSHPLSARVSFELSLSQRLRLEAHALTITPSEIRVDLVRDPSAGFSQQELYGYLGGLLQWTPTSKTALGVLGTWVRARIDRQDRGSGGPDNDFALTEREIRWGFYGIQRLARRWSLEGWVVRLIRPEERLHGDTGAVGGMRYKDQAWTGRFAGTYQAPGGFRGELGLDLVARGIEDPAAVPERAFLADNNYRLRFDFGWRFGSRALLVVGSNVDLDRDRGTAIGAFDGGHGRFAFYW